MLVFPERVLNGDDPQPRLPPPLRTGQPVGARRRFKVFGVSLLTERFFGLVQQLAIVFGIYALARRWGRRLAVAGARDCRRSSSSRSASPRSRGSARSGSGSRARRRHRRARRIDERRRAVGRARAGCCSASRAVPSRPRPRGRRSRRRARARASTARASQAAARRVRASASRAVRRPPRDRGPRQRVSRAWSSTPSSTCAAAAACRSRRRGATSTASCSGRARSQQLRGRSRRSRVRSSCSCGSSLLLGVDRASCSCRAWRAVRRRARVVRGPHAARRRAVQPRASSRRRCNASTPPTSRGSAASRSAFLPVALFEFAPPAPAAVAACARSRSRRRRGDRSRCRVRDPGVHRAHVRRLRAADVRLRTALRTRSSTTAAPSTTASRTGPRPRTSASREAGAHREAGPEAVRRAGEPAQDAVQRRVPLLHAPASSSPARTTSRWIRAWPTPTTPASTSSSRRPTSRSCRRSGTTGASRTTPASPGRTRPQRVLARDFCHVGTYLRPATSCTSGAIDRCDSRTAAIALPAPCALLDRHADLPGGGEHRRVPAAHARGRPRRRHPRRRRQQPRRHRRHRREGRRRARPHRRAAAAEEDRARRRVPRRLRGRHRARLRHRSCRSTPTSRTIRPRSRTFLGAIERRRRRRHRLALRARRLDPALAVAPARAVEVGQPLRRRSCSACRSATRRRATARTAPTS